MSTRATEAAEREIARLNERIAAARAALMRGGANNYEKVQAAGLILGCARLDAVDPWSSDEEIAEAMGRSEP